MGIFFIEMNKKSLCAPIYCYRNVVVGWVDIVLDRNCTANSMDH